MFPRISISGTPFERGKELGEKATKQIKHNIEAYKNLFYHFANLDWVNAKDKASKYIPWIERYDIEIMEEIRGISEGAQVDLLDIVALNARSEIILNSDGCTSIAAVPPASNEDTLLAQNWDWGSFIHDGIIILEIDQYPKPKILMATEAGIVGKIGMNNAGIGVCLNLLGTQKNTDGVPIHVLLRGVLNSKNLPQAIGQSVRMNRGTAANFLIAHKEGEAVNMEMSSEDFDVLYSKKSVIAHANHFIGPRSVNLQDTARIKYPDTHIRQGRIYKLIDLHETFDIDTFKSILSDHNGAPDGICRHGEEIKPDLGRPEAVNTVFSIVMNLSKGFFEITDGQPCKEEYQTYHFSIKEELEV